jgi:hypothetical protein
MAFFRPEWFMPGVGRQVRRRVALGLLALGWLLTAAAALAGLPNS